MSDALTIYKNLSDEIKDKITIFKIFQVIDHNLKIYDEEINDDEMDRIAYFVYDLWLNDKKCPFSIYEIIDFIMDIYVNKDGLFDALFEMRHEDLYELINDFYIWSEINNPNDIYRNKVKWI